MCLWFIPLCFIHWFLHKRQQRIKPGSPHERASVFSSLKVSLQCFPRRSTFHLWRWFQPILSEREEKKRLVAAILFWSLCPAVTQQFCPLELDHSVFSSFHIKIEMSRTALQTKRLFFNNSLCSFFSFDHSIMCLLRLFFLKFMLSRGLVCEPSFAFHVQVRVWSIHVWKCRFLFPLFRL